MRTDMCVVSQSTFDWFVGLSTEERSDATCVNLRLLTCFDDIGDDPGDLVTKLAKLTKDHPDATCEKAEEAAA
jgi:hypothetical protein